MALTRQLWLTPTSRPPYKVTNEMHIESWRQKNRRLCVLWQLHAVGTRIRLNEPSLILDRKNVFLANCNYAVVRLSPLPCGASNNIISRARTCASTKRYSFTLHIKRIYVQGKNGCRRPVKIGTREYIFTKLLSCNV